MLKVLEDGLDLWKMLADQKSGLAEVSKIHDLISSIKNETSIGKRCNRSRPRREDK
jgi:hypothetical protein